MRELELYETEYSTGEQRYFTTERISGRLEFTDPEILDYISFADVYATAIIPAGSNHGIMFCVNEHGNKYDITKTQIFFRDVPEDEWARGSYPNVPSEGKVWVMRSSRNGTGFLSNLERQEAIDVCKAIINNLNVQ